MQSIMMHSVQTVLCWQQARWGAPNTFDHPFC